MSITGLINNLKGQYRKRQDDLREARLAKTATDRVRAEKIVAQNKAIAANQKIIEQARQSEHERRFGKAKAVASGFRGFGQKVTARLEARSKQQTPASQILSGPKNTYNPIYHGAGGKGAGNIFTQTSGSNPFTFSNQPVKEKAKPKTIIIKKY